MQQARLSFDALLGALQAAGEETRLRLLALLSEAELTVTELVTILGQSQPRISRHLKLLVEAGLVVRHREGSWAFFLAAPGGAAGEIARAIAGWFDPQDPVLVVRPLASCRGAPRPRRAGGALFRRAGRRTGTSCARCMCRRSASRPRCATSSGTRPFTRCSISAPAPAACSNCWRRSPIAPSASTSRRQCSPSRARVWNVRACATCSFVRATSTPCPSSRTATISSSCIRSCTISTIPAAHCAKPHACCVPAGGCFSSISRHMPKRHCASTMRIAVSVSVRDEIAAYLDEAGARSCRPPRSAAACR